MNLNTEKSEMICESAGVVIVKNTDKDKNKIEILLMRNMDYWDFPKGKIEKNESKIQAAIREVKEETTIEDLNFKWSKAYYSTYPYGINKKIVHYFVAETKKEKIKLEKNPETGIIEHDEFRWVSITEAEKILNKRVNKVLKWALDKIISFNQ